MTGVALALAGLTCGDGGPGMRVASAPVAVRLDGEWEGEMFTNSGKTGTVRIGGGKIVLKYPDGVEFPGPLRLVPAGEGRLRLDSGRAARVMNAIYKVERGRLVICYATDEGRWPRVFGPGKDGGYLFVLRPAAPPKP